MVGIKIVVLIFGCQVLIQLFGFCFGMFSFFWKYEKKILRRFGLIKKKTGDHLIQNGNSQAENFDKTPRLKEQSQTMTNKEPLDTHRLAVFASGTGSNAQQIIKYFRDKQIADVALIVSNNSKAGVLNIAAIESIQLLLVEKNKFIQTGYVEELKKNKIDFIILAGFLWKIPAILIQAYPNRIINIHPALLPAYGGKGMYGNAVHLSVINAKEKQSGITIHFVDEHYDHGKIIFQSTCAIDEKENAETLAKKIHKLEHEFYPQQIEKVLRETDG